MKRDRTLVGGIILLALLIGAVVIGAIWYFVLRTPEEASEPIEAIPLDLPTSEPTSEPEPTAEPTAVPPTPTEAAAEAEAEPTATPTAVPEPTATADPGVLRLYEISQADSEARFIIDEVLNGEPNTVIGVTDQVAGQIAVNFSDLSTTQVGAIQVNARTFVTDNNFRNNAIRNRILFTDEFEFITFTPTAVNGLPENIEVGQEVSFEIVGDLTVRDITQEATFTVTATAVSEEQLVGSASATVLRSDYELQIPSVPGVADVSDEFQLELDFIANQVES